MNVNETRSLDEGLPFNSRIPVRVPMNISRLVLLVISERCIPKFATKQRRYGQYVECWNKVQEFGADVIGMVVGVIMFIGMYLWLKM